MERLGTMIDQSKQVPRQCDRVSGQSSDRFNRVLRKFLKRVGNGTGAIGINPERDGPNPISNPDSSAAHAMCSLIAVTTFALTSPMSSSAALNAT